MARRIPLLVFACGPLLACAAPNEPGAASSGDATGSGDQTSADESDSSDGESADDGVDETESTGTNDDDGPVLDVAPDDGDCGDVGDVHPYIWVANSGQGTVSKIDTDTMVEEGRYLVRADAAGDPSRTSVNLAGDVAVANRNGGVTKVWARPERCVEHNGMPGLQTSSGADDVLAWEVEECVAWHTEFPQYSRQRPVAWTRGEQDPDSCDIVHARVWTAGATEAADSLEIVRLHGEDGSVETTIEIPEVNATGFGAYGGAVDADGNFYVSFYGGAKAFIAVDFETTDYELHQIPDEMGVAYGITVDEAGRAWVCGDGVARFDPADDSWAFAHHDAQPLHTGPIYAGCQTSGDRLWVSMMMNQPAPHPLRAIDTETLEIVQGIDLPVHLHGVSIDTQGRVWGVPAYSTDAYRVDPDTEKWEIYSGLTSAYTYSDMTGYALSHAGAAG
jgi:hypothetical protein